MKIIKFLPVFFFLFPLYADDEKPPEYSYPCKSGVPYARNDKRKTLLKCATSARESATIHLQNVNYLIDELKNVKDCRLKERLKTFIEVSLATVLIPDPKLKFLTIALGMFSDLIINEGLDKSEIIYQIYQEFSLASASLEISNYYNRLFLDDRQWLSYNDERFWLLNQTLDHLTVADMLTTSLKDEINGGVISFYITQIRTSMMNDLIENKNLEYHYVDKLEILMDNFGEIAAPSLVQNSYIIGNIEYQLHLALSRLQYALYFATNYAQYSLNSDDSQYSHLNHYSQQ